MSSFFSDALVSLGVQPSASRSSPRGGQTHHEFFVSSNLLPLMIQLQKETRGRKFREIHDTLQNAVTQLSTFQNEEWPPKLGTVPTNDKPDDETAETAEFSTPTGQIERQESSPGVDPEPVSETRNKPDPPESQIPSSRNNNERKPKTKSLFSTNPSDDDPQTREPMHDAVYATLEALIAILSHPSKTTKACEIALDGVARLVSRRYVSGRAGGKGDNSASGTMGDPSQPSLVHRLLESVSKCNELSTDIVQLSMVKTLKAILTSPKCGVHEGSMLLALRTTFHVYLVTKSTQCKDTAKSALLDMIRSVLTRMEAHHAVAKTLEAQLGKNLSYENGDIVSSVVNEPETDVWDASRENIPMSSQYHTDSYALFRSLCKISSKELPADISEELDRSRLFLNTGIPTDPFALNSKILSLELILTALEVAGDAFCSEDKFIYLIQHYLCSSLLKNCVSHHTQVAYLSQKIFLTLIKKFKGHLKHEIEVFLSNVFLRVLDSPNSSFKQKALVLESLRSLCADPSLLTQIFLNYDCDFDAVNLYKDIVHMLTKLSGRATAAPSASLKKDLEQDVELSLAGLEVLVTIVKAFLKTLGLPVGDEDTDDSAGSKIRGILQLDVGMAVSNEEATDSKHVSTDNSVASSDMSEPFSRLQSDHADAADASGSADVAGRIVDAFQMKRTQEQNFEIGSVKFTLSLKGGLQFFIQNNFVKCEAKDIALFFLSNKEKLDKTQIGEALGRETDAAFVKGDGVDAEKGGPGFWFRILHHYVDAQDFRGMQFDDAIRHFLAGFRLPGEAQKIDRIMEKFAERYTAQNVSVFPSADTAFILAFSVIMLNTDLHNPSIKPERRMTVESFIKNNRGIGENGSDLPEDFLREIFDRIKEKPFSLKEDDAARERVGAQRQALFDTSVLFEGTSFFGTNADERKRDNFKKERDEMMAMTEQLIRRRSFKDGRPSQSTPSLTDTIAPAEVVKPMFDVTWGPLLGILSQILECSEDERFVAVCLNGFVYAIRVSSRSNMSLARDTFVSSLAKFTFLGSIKEMKRKNVESIRTLLSIAVIDGEYLGESWGPVLQCISQLARLRLTASGLDADEAFLTDKDSPRNRLTSSRQTEVFFRPSNRHDLAKEMEESNGRAVLEAVQEVLIDKVFSSTASLSARSLALFIEQLIAVSANEINGQSKRVLSSVELISAPSDGSLSISRTGKGDGPSIFSLQKLVEVADFNMDIRPRLVWTQIWEIMADFFARIACHENTLVSVFAIDSLKQLSLKFLKKPELSEFNFQRLFLKPFLDVMEDKHSREDVRELVLRCIDNMIQTKSYNLRSGWKVVFSILKNAASDPSEKIERLGLAVLQRMLDEHLDEVCNLSTPLESEISAGIIVSEPLERNPKYARSAIDDFINLCRASLSFVQKDATRSPRSAGLAMRALCHTAIYADLLAAQRIFPSDSVFQSTDPNQPGYTYEGLNEKESREMIQWRPLLDGLAEGVISQARNNIGAFGCIIPRASLLAVRAILLRHGHLFTVSQLTAIFQYTILPAFQEAAERDTTPVVHIVSESPSISNIDFLATPPPLPPPPDDPNLLMLEATNSSEKRAMGPAELMLEASFTDLRHGGDGDLRRAYILARKGETSARKDHEQPFPDSWIATVAPLALGLLTDVISELIMTRFDLNLVAIVTDQYRLWFLGGYHAGSSKNNMWTPCEALVRATCNELKRLSRCLFQRPCTPLNVSKECAVWLIELYIDLLEGSTAKQSDSLRSLVEWKEATKRLELDTGLDEVEETGSMVVTPFGAGRLLGRRQDRYIVSGTTICANVDIISLDFGATLYQAQRDEDRDFANRKIPAEVDVPGGHIERHVPVIKIRCIAGYSLVSSIDASLPLLVTRLRESSLEALMNSLENSRLLAFDAFRNGVVSSAFQESLILDWGDGIGTPDDTVEDAARMSLQHSSAVFFVSQEAIVAKAIMHLLSLLYASGDVSKVRFAERHIPRVLQDTMSKFLASDGTEDPATHSQVHRDASANKALDTKGSGKLSLHNSLFVPVMVEILQMILAADSNQFELHKHIFFPTVCDLVMAQNEEIRALVKDILHSKITPLLHMRVESMKRYC